MKSSTARWYSYAVVNLCSVVERIQSGTAGLRSAIVMARLLDGPGRSRILASCFQNPRSRFASLRALSGSSFGPMPANRQPSLPATYLDDVVLSA